jgi:mannose-1-phosphate guanylyltransferase
MKNQVWTIVLAAGAGRRLESVTGGVPKQFWQPEGSRSTLLGRTLSRLYPLSVPERTLTVVDRTHRPYIGWLRDEWPLGDVIYQPADRGTAAGVLLPLVSVLSASRDAIVIITPSDHAIEDAFSFRRGVANAVVRVQSGASDVVLFGAEPDDVLDDYGWITPYAGDETSHGVFQRVVGFVEKPSYEQACLLFELGAVWHTMVVVARASALLARFREHLPFHTDVILNAGRMPSEARDAFLSDWYPELPAADFSRDLLTPSKDLWVYTWPPEIGWSDLGTPDRVEAWMALQHPLRSISVQL